MNPATVIERVPCPTCNARAHQPCRGYYGRMQNPHTKRWHAERDAFLVEHGYEPLGLEVAV